MRTLTALADDLTGACDVAAEIAIAGRRVRVIVDPAAVVDRDDGVAIVNTQSRGLDPKAAYARVRQVVRAAPASVVLKKIDTALRGHVGAELDAVLDVQGAPAFVLAAIPAAGRLTRGGCQWFGDRWLAETEFARDPEGAGPESSIPAVLARESRRKVAVIGCHDVRSGRLGDQVARHREQGVEIFVVDAECDADVRAAVAGILSLPRPVCLAGSIALAAALAPSLGHGVRMVGEDGIGAGVPVPALIVNGSLHSRARAQIDAALAHGLAVTLAAPVAGAGAAEVSTLADVATAALVAGTSVIVSPPPPETAPDVEALRATEQILAASVMAIAERHAIAALVLIGGESSHAVLMRLGAGMLAVTGRVAPLIARGTIMAGRAAGAVVVTKGGSGGEPDIVARLLAAGRERLLRGTGSQG